MQTIKIERIVRSKRKTIALVVTHDATLVVRAPFNTSLECIDKMVSRKISWIRRKISEIASRSKQTIKEFVNGERFLYLGASYQLCIVDDPGCDILLNDMLCISKGVLPNIREALITWYKSEALKIITERCNWYTHLTGHKPVSIKISDAKTRWGSCGAKGTLNFSWRLIMAPLEVIDLVVVHEVVHLEQQNHSRLFWDKVKSILPDYETRDRWLKENNHLINIP